VYRCKGAGKPGTSGRERERRTVGGERRKTNQSTNKQKQKNKQNKKYTRTECYRRIVLVTCIISSIREPASVC